MKYRIVGGFSFYERAEIKDLVSYLTVSLNPDDSVHLLRVINMPPRGIGKTTTDILEELAVERGTSVWGAIEIAVEQARLPMRTIRALEAFHALIAEFVGAAEELSDAGFPLRGGLVASWRRLSAGGGQAPLTAGDAGPDEL